MQLSLDVVAWAPDAADHRRLEAHRLVWSPAGLDGLADLLAERAWDAVVLLSDEAEELRAATDVVRAHPPDGFLLVAGSSAPLLFPDGADLPFEVWPETELASAGKVLGRALESLLEREALRAVRANRRVYKGLASALDLDAPVGDAVAEAMHVIARELGCRAASFWQPAAGGGELRRVGCTGPLRELDRAAAGDDRTPVCGDDRLLRLPLDGTPAGTVMRSGVARFPIDDEALLLPATSSGRVVGVVVLAGAEEVAGRPTTFELGLSACSPLAAFVQLREAEARFRAVTSSATDAIVVADATGTVTSFNIGAETMFGRPAAEVIGEPLTLLMPASFAAAHQRALDGVSGGAPTRLVGQVLELTGRRGSGEEFPIELTLSAWSSGPERRYAGIIRDISERRRAAERIRALAFVDRVTGLGNGPAALERLGELEGTCVAVVAVDLARFASVVEALGARAGDELLRTVGARLIDVLPGSRAFRRSRDEFLVLLEDADEAAMATAAEAVRAAASAPVVVAGAELAFEPHVGTALATVDRAETLVDQVLRALAAAREAGPGSIRRFEDVRAHVRTRLGLEGELRAGIPRGELVLHHQPVVDLATGAVRGVEALVRWQHPEHGLLFPDAFIPLAEQSGLIADIGCWVIDEACRQAAGWAASGLDLEVAFNLSPRELLAGDVAAHTARALARTGADPHRLMAEITETTALRDLEGGRAVLDDLRALGLRIALDDFGVGESSLGRLAALPVHVLKLDRSLVRGLPADRASQALVRAAIQLALGLGLEPLAEGVEDGDQRDWLVEHGCRSAQGYFFGRPMPAGEIPGVVRGLEVLVTR